MKVLMASAALLMLTSTAGVYAQSAGPYYSDTIHQSTGGRDSRGFPKYYQRQHESRQHVSMPAGAYASAEPSSSTQGSQSITNEERLWYKRVDQR